MKFIKVIFYVKKKEDATSSFLLLYVYTINVRL